MPSEINDDWPDQQYWYEVAQEKAKEKELEVVREETETELYAKFKDGVLIEKGQREVPVKSGS